MGRNWDNPNVGSIMVNIYHPPDGYTSISFSRAIDLGFPINLDLEVIKSIELGERLLLAHVYVFDGINETGLSVAIASLTQTSVEQKDDKEMIFVTYLVRKILDQTKNIKEADNLVESYISFGLDKNSLNAHYLIVDSSGRSVILEYVHGIWMKTYANKSWQILTNRQIFNASDSKLKASCSRYQSISETL